MKLDMQDKHLYEYAVIRIVPKIEREEFINVGLNRNVMIVFPPERRVK